MRCGYSRRKRRFGRVFLQGGPGGRQPGRTTGYLYINQATTCRLRRVYFSTGKAEVHREGHLSVQTEPVLGADRLENRLCDRGLT